MRERGKKVIKSMIALRGLLVIGCLVVGACMPSAAPVSPTTPPAAPVSPTTPAAAPVAQTGLPTGANWESIIAGSRTEGALNTTATSRAAQAVLAKFEERYPWIKIQNFGDGIEPFTARLVTEQKNGLFGWDLIFMQGFNSIEATLAPAGAMADIRPFLAELPADITDDKNWAGGFAMYRSNESPDSLITNLNLTFGVLVNREQLTPAQLSSVDQLTEPQFKGKITSRVLTYTSAASQAIATMSANGKSEDFLTKLFVDQGVFYQEQPAAVAQSIATGQ
jgi:hypothetical protein